MEMDATRAAFGHDEPWHGMRAGTFKHFVLSPDPGDEIDLESLRELSSAWALRFFPDNQIAIVYHDNNERGIPHAHIVLNSTNLMPQQIRYEQKQEELIDRRRSRTAQDEQRSQATRQREQHRRRSER